MDNEYVKGADEVIRKLKAIEDYIEHDIAIVIGTEAVNHFKESFVNEGFTDTSLTKWQSRKTKRASGPDAQSVLSKSGELADSIEFKVQGGNVVLIVTDKKYAQIHNEGGTIPVTDNMKKYFWAMHFNAKEMANEDLANQFKWLALAKEIKIPKRQFIGESEMLNERISAKIVRDLTNIFNS